MRAMVFREYGPPDVLRLEELPTPTPGEGEVLVRVRAASINEWDWGVLRGTPFVNRLLFGLRRPRRQVLGLALAGEVAAVGPGATRYRPGDIIMREGDSGDSLLVITTGLVMVKRNKPYRRQVSLTRLGMGQCIGEMSLLTGRPRSASARVGDARELAKIPCPTSPPLRLAL